MATQAFATGAYQASQALTSPGSVTKKPASAEQGTPGFAAMVGNGLDSVLAKSQNAEVQTMQALSGKANIVDVVTAVAEAEALMDTFIALQQQAIAAYREVQQMPV
jgi:flagellar hook-basal body complex protein FliE